MTTPEGSTSGAQPLSSHRHRDRPHQKRPHTEAEHVYKPPCRKRTRSPETRQVSIVAQRETPPEAPRPRVDPACKQTRSRAEHRAPRATRSRLPHSRPRTEQTQHRDRHASEHSETTSAKDSFQKFKWLFLCHFVLLVNY